VSCLSLSREFALISAATPDAIAASARALRDGALVAFPTETVYGLGADARNPAALRLLYAAKGRPDEHPVIVHLCATSSLPRWAHAVPSFAQALAEAFWPGPLTLILPRADGVSDLVTGGQDSIGLRVPDHPVAQALLAQFAKLGGDGVAAPSANRFGRVSATTAAHVADEFGAQVAVILDGGACEHGIESTIVDCTRDEPAILRPGAISVLQLARVLGKPPRAASADAPRASGTLAASASTSAARPMIPSPSRNHCTSAPAMKALPSSANVVCPSMVQATVPSMPVVDRTGLAPTFISRKAPVP